MPGPWQRAATCWTQAVLVLRWFIDRPDVHLLARDARLSQATAYRYLHEAIDVIAQQAPDLLKVLAAGREAGWGFVWLDGTLIQTSRSAAKSAADTSTPSRRCIRPPPQDCRRSRRRASPRSLLRKPQ